MSEPINIGIFSSHPIQYKSPLFRILANQRNINIIVYYYSSVGLVETKHKYHGVVHAWDVPLLDGYPFKFLPNLIRKSSWRIKSFQPFFNPAVMKEILRERFDLVIIHSYQYPSDWIAFYSAKFINAKVLFYGEMYPRGHLNYLQKISRHLIHNRMILGSEACLAIGTVAADVYRKEYGLSDEKIFLAPYAVDNDYFINSSSQWKSKQSLLKSDMGVNPDLPVVLCVAGMVPKKRQQDLIDAMKTLDLPARLVLVGHGPMYDEVFAYCQEHLPDTKFAGFVNQTVLPRYYAMADIFVLPSLWEEFGLVVNEAMCAGLPIITSNTVAASRDLIYEGENGYTVPPGDVLNLARKIHLLLEDEDMRHDFGKRSLDVISRWNYFLTIEGIQKAIDYVISN